MKKKETPRTGQREETAAAPARPENPTRRLLKVVQPRPRSARRRPRPAATPNFRDDVIAEMLKMTGAAPTSGALAEDRIKEILPDNPRAITYQDFTEILMFHGHGATSAAFFRHFFGEGFQTLESLREGVHRVRLYSFLFHGSFERGFEELRKVTDDGVFARPPWDLLPVNRRPEMTTDRIHPLSAAEAYETGYLIPAPTLSPQQIGKAKKKGEANAEWYMAMNGVDVYIAGSMRELRDFEEADELVRGVREKVSARGLGLTFFNPLWAYVPDQQQKGLLEVLMLRKASAMLFIAGIKDSFGKDSELATMLAQGKPVIVYVPSVPEADKRHKDFEDHYEMFQKKHPLAMQCDLRTGVANGVMVARDIDTCGELLIRLFTNSVEFDIGDDDPNNHFLRERITGSRVRVITKNQLLTASFWNQYLGDDPRRAKLETSPPGGTMP